MLETQQVRSGERIGMKVRLSKRGEFLLGGLIATGMVLVMWLTEIVSTAISGVPS